MPRQTECCSAADYPSSVFCPIFDPLLYFLFIFQFGSARPDQPDYLFPVYICIESKSGSGVFLIAVCFVHFNSQWKLDLAWAYRLALTFTYQILFTSFHVILYELLCFVNSWTKLCRLRLVCCIKIYLIPHLILIDWHKSYFFRSISAAVLLLIDARWDERIITALLAKEKITPLFHNVFHFFRFTLSISSFS